MDFRTKVAFQNDLVQQYVGTYTESRPWINVATDWCDRQSGWLEQPAYDQAWGLIVDKFMETWTDFDPQASTHASSYCFETGVRFRVYGSVFRV